LLGADGAGADVTLLMSCKVGAPLSVVFGDALGTKVALEVGTYVVFASNGVVVGALVSLAIVAFVVDTVGDMVVFTVTIGAMVGSKLCTVPFVAVAVGTLVLFVPVSIGEAVGVLVAFAIVEFIGDDDGDMVALSEIVGDDVIKAHISCPSPIPSPPSAAQTGSAKLLKYKQKLSPFRRVVTHASQLSPVLAAHIALSLSLMTDAIGEEVGDAVVLIAAIGEVVTFCKRRVELMLSSAMVSFASAMVSFTLVMVSFAITDEIGDEVAIVADEGALVSVGLNDGLEVPMLEGAPEGLEEEVPVGRFVGPNVGASLSDSGL